MLDQVAAAFERQDYRAAAQLLQELQQQSPQDPWVQFYQARLQEVAGKPEAAEQIYRQLLRDCPNPKLMSQARQGLQRLETAENEQRQQAIAQAVTNPTNQEPGFLVLEAIAPEIRNAAVQTFSQIMKVDAYTARGLLPSRGWRLYRTGPVGELGVYGQELRNAGIPVFWAALPDLQKIKVFQVKYFQVLTPKPTVVCLDETNQLGALTFDWTEVAQRVEGLLPLFSQVVDLGYRDRLEWKEHVEDYAHFCDLHLPQRRCILRLYDDKYDFHQGVSAQTQHDTIRQHWNDLKLFLDQQLAQRPLWSEFIVFAETVSDFDSAIGRLKSHMPIPRASDCSMDSAFHLYSSLAFLQLGQ